MEKLFHNKKSCNPDIGSWDVSSVTNFVSDDESCLSSLLNFLIIYEMECVIVFVFKSRFLQNNSVIMILDRVACFMVPCLSTKTLVVGMYRMVLTL